MTLDTLMGRLQRLKRLAELVHADDYAKTLEAMLGELEESSPTSENSTSGNPTEVDPALLSSLRHRLLNSDPPKTS